MLGFMKKTTSSSLQNNKYFNVNFNKTRKIEIENRNSILNKFRKELYKSQMIINRELARSKDLKIKFLKKKKKQQAEEEAKQQHIKMAQSLNLQTSFKNISNSIKSNISK